MNDCVQKDRYVEFGCISYYTSSTSISIVTVRWNVK
jgi:hypothetical protein